MIIRIMNSNNNISYYQFFFLFFLNPVYKNSGEERLIHSRALLSPWLIWHIIFTL